MGNYYSFSEKYKNFFSLLLTRVFYKNARLIRYPFYCRGKKNLKYGKGFTTGYRCRFDLLSEYKNEEPTLVFGENCRIGDYVHITALEKVTIGNNALLASKIYITDTSHGEYNRIDDLSIPSVSPNDRPLVTQKVIIGNNVWIGENVVILSGVTIGDGCIIGANSVVTKSIPDNSIAAGSPATIKKRFNNERNKWEKI